MTNTDNRKPRIIAVAVTLIVIVMLIALMIAGHMSVKTVDPDREWPPRHHAEIILEPQEPEVRYVTTISDASDNATEDDLDDTTDYGPSDIDSDAPTQTSHNAVNAGHNQGAATPPQTSNAESPVKIRPNDKPAGNRTPNPDDAAAAEARRQQQAKANIDNKMSQRFSGAGKEGGKAAANDADGTSSAPGKGTGRGLGMTASVNQTPKSDKVGVIVITCTVLPDGKVQPGSAQFSQKGSSGQAATDVALKQRCIEATYRCQFSRPTSDTDNRPGTIKFNFVDKN